MSEYHNKESEMNEKDDDLRPEYDISKFFKEGVKGKYAERCRKEKHVVMIDGEEPRGIGEVDLEDRR